MERKETSSTIIKAAILALVCGTVFCFFVHNHKTRTLASHPSPQRFRIPPPEAAPPTESMITSPRPEPRSVAARPTPQTTAKPDKKDIPSDPVEFEKWAAADIRAQFSDKIRAKSNQMELLGLRSYLMDQYPMEWTAMLYNILDDALPEFSDEIIDTFSKYDAYQLWLEENKQLLAEMSYPEMKAMIRHERQQLFGLDADEIWPPESNGERVQDTLAILDKARDISLEDKLQTFKSAVDDTYLSSADDDSDSDYREEYAQLNANQKYGLAISFLTMQSVQTELKNMDAETRTEALRRIRGTMGFDEATLEALALDDARKEQRWQTGREYMTDRESLTQEFAGAELQAGLQALRERYFKSEAPTIAAEEDNGFFRYNRTRIYGRN